jgi:hypothetical protein
MKNLSPFSFFPRGDTNIEQHGYGNGFKGTTFVVIGQEWLLEFNSRIPSLARSSLCAHNHFQIDAFVFTFTSAFGSAIPASYAGSHHIPPRRDYSNVDVWHCDQT